VWCDLDWHYYYKCTPDSDSEIRLKIDQHLTKLRRTKQSVPVFGPPCILQDFAYTIPAAGGRSTPITAEGRAQERKRPLVFGPRHQFSLGSPAFPLFPGAPEGSWKWGGDTLAPSAGKKFCRARPLFWLYVYNWSFWRVLSWWLIWSVSCFCFSNHGAPRAQPFVKMRGRCPRALFIRCRWLFLFVRNVHCKLTLFNIHLCVEMCILRKQWRF